MAEKLTITDYGMDGVGIAHSQRTHFLKNAILGEEVEIVGNKTKVVTSSPNRVKPFCPYFETCGGCNLQHMNEAEQQNYKTIYVKNCLNKYKVNYNKKFDYKKNNNLYYRNKISFAVREENGENKIGLFQQKTHKIVEIDECLITDKQHIKLLEVFREYLKQKVSCFCEETKKGNIKNIVVRFCENNLLICVVGTKNVFPQKEKLIELLSTLNEKFSLSFCFNSNPKTILNTNIKTVFGEEEINVEKNGLVVAQNIGSFFQVNDEISSQIYDYVSGQIKTQSVVVDAYSGAGTMTAMLAKKAKFAIGVECNIHAVKASQKLFEQNNVKNATVLLGRCEDLIPTIITKDEIKIDTTKAIKFEKDNLFCVLDPPRKGCDKRVIDAIKKSEISNIIYVSCEPITLSRDLQELTKVFNIEKICLFDMFYLTSRVETVVCLKRR